MREKKILEKLIILNLSHGIAGFLLKNDEACGKPLARGSAEFVSSEFQKNQSNKGATMEHLRAISPHHVPYMNDVYDMVRKAYARPADDPMKDLNVKMAIWGIFINATSEHQFISEMTMT